MPHIVVVGGGQAGSSLSAKLRSDGFQGDITFLAAEPVPPYQRPPLSKAYLLGEMSQERLYLRPRAFYDDQAIDLRLNASVAAMDPDAKTVQVDGTSLRYDQLALTTGARPRRLPAAMGGDLDRVFTVRTLADVDALRPHMQSGARVLVVGGGFIGLEAAAVAAKSALDVTVLEKSDRILQRVVSPETADLFRALHMSHGVSIVEGTGLLGLARAGSTIAATLDDGQTLCVDMVIVGVGIEPETALARSAGLAVENGIRVDAFGRTSDSSIWAAGDCACFEFRGTWLRLESVQNAIDQGECVAANMLGARRPYSPTPWFWSDQYDVKLQIAGLNLGHDRVISRPGSIWYFRGETLLAVDAMNDPRAFMVAKRLIASGRSPAPELCGDPATDLKSLLG